MNKVKHKPNDTVNGFILLAKETVKDYWKVRCGCGNEYVARLSAIKKQKHCRKCNPKGVNHHSWLGCGELSHDLYTSFKHSAKAKKLEFNVTIHYLWSLFLKQNRKCVFTGEELHFNRTYKSKKNKTASLDRIDSLKGYVEGNLQWIHKDVNKLKKNFSDERFIEICKKVAQYKNI